jgi:hypothetical protein
LSGTLGGRTRVASRAVPHFVPRTPVAAAVGTCVTETFDTADSATLGPDQTWLTSAFTAMRCVPEIKSNTLAMNGSEVTSVTSARTFYTRAQTDAGFDDMAVSVEWSAVGTLGTGAGQFTQQEVGVLARVENITSRGAYSDDPASWQNASSIIYCGYNLIWGDSSSADPFVQLDVGWFNTADSTIYTVTALLDDTGIPTASAGDVLSLTVTGTGAATAVTGEINGVTYCSMTGTSIAAAVVGTVPTVDPDDFSTGQRGGIYSRQRQSSGGGWTTANDYVNRFDNFEVCPA